MAPPAPLRSLLQPPAGSSQGRGLCGEGRSQRRRLKPDWTERYQEVRGAGPATATPPSDPTHSGPTHSPLPFLLSTFIFLCFFLGGGASCEAANQGRACSRDTPTHQAPPTPPCPPSPPISHLIGCLQQLPDIPHVSDGVQGSASCSGPRPSATPWPRPQAQQQRLLQSRPAGRVT